jgi:cell division protein FtsB
MLAFATAVLLIDAFVGEKGLLEGLRARASYRQAEASLNRLRAENRQLRETMRLYRDDKAAQEQLVRETLGYIRPGEVLFIVRDGGSAAR